MFWSTLGRMIVVPLAFLVSAIISLLVLLSLGYERVVQVMTGKDGPDAIDAVFGIFSHGMVIASGMTILPALALVIIGEVARIRSALFYILGGGAALAAVPLFARFGQQAGAAGGNIAVWQVFATAGFAGGFIYWLLAGRRA